MTRPEAIPGMTAVRPHGIPRVLSIAGTDPTGGAGIQADLKSIAANGGYGMAVVTALVAQNTHGVRSVHQPPVEFLTEQLESVSDDVRIDAVKIGMLGSARVIEVVSAWLDRVRPPVVVLDPVMVATSGDRLLDRDAEQALRAMAERVDLVTPNIPELAILADEPVADDWQAVLAQAARLSSRCGVTVLAKGGHLGGEQAPDALVDATGGEVRVEQFTAERIPTRHTHGTGCSLSAALATRRPLTDGWGLAVAETKRWLTESIRRGAELDVGTGNGPIHHFAGLWARGGTRTAPEPAEVARQWWSDVRAIRAEIDDLPFVRHLGEGTLGREPFVWYLAQDAIYLREFARMLAAASRLAPTPQEQAFWAAGAQGAIVTELALHESWIPDGAMFAAEPARQTTAYLDHLAAAGAGGDYPVLVAALLPCFWIYQDVGDRLRPRSHPGHPYRSWLDTYADEEFAVSTRRAIEVVTRAASAADEVTRGRMHVAFVRSVEHEREFFAAPLG